MKKKRKKEFIFESLLFRRRQRRQRRQRRDGGGVGDDGGRKAAAKSTAIVVVVCVGSRRRRASVDIWFENDDDAKKKTLFFALLLLLLLFVCVVVDISNRRDDVVVVRIVGKNDDDAGRARPNDGDAGGVRMVSSAVEEGLLEEKAVVDDALENQNLCPSCKRIQRLVSNEGKIFQRNEAEIGSTSAVSSGETVFVCFVRVKRNNWVRHRDDSINNRPGWSAKCTAVRSIGIKRRRRFRVRRSVCVFMEERRRSEREANEQNWKRGTVGRVKS